MRVHFLNCMTLCPPLSRRLTCTCLLVETPRELVLIDTGLGTRDVEDPRSRLSGFFLFLLSPELRREHTAIRQIERLGYDPRDVRHVVLTHLDFDHAGGLDDFPHAAVHLLAAEKDYALAQRTMLDRMRFRPQQWSTRANWRAYDYAAGEPWFGFDGVHSLAGLPPELLLVPLPGHTFGHAGIAVLRQNGWLLHAGDAYFHHAEMDLERPRCTPGLRLYQRMMEKDRGSRLATQARLRELKRLTSEVEVFCAHDTREFDRLTPAPRVERRSNVMHLKGVRTLFS
jgi:glyoxylase-like metal-dependent hydrolase (beta-lactamase superfamily II)